MLTILHYWERQNEVCGCIPHGRGTVLKFFTICNKEVCNKEVSQYDF